jgi:hypothetical protein
MVGKIKMPDVVALLQDVQTKHFESGQAVVTAELPTSINSVRTQLPMIDNSSPQSSDRQLQIRDSRSRYTV